MDTRGDNFRKILQEEATWPHMYMFKFIVKQREDLIKQVETLFPKDSKITKKPSKTGKYVSISIQMMVHSADEVIGYYEKAANIEGIYAL